MMNAAIARELQVSIQYMWQNVEARGVKGTIARETIRKIAITEMQHAEDIADRLVFLGGRPTTQPSKVTVGDDLEEMLREDVKSEEEAIDMYNQIIELAEQEGDVVTRKLFENILIDEEKHLDDFQTMLEE